MRYFELMGWAQMTPNRYSDCVAFIEALSLLAILLLGLALYFGPQGAFRRAGALLDRVARHRRLCVLGVTVAVILVRLVMLPWDPVPVPVIHDEYSFLLGAETFNLDRLTNPTPPLWAHFETFHVNMVPTYQTMYPPATSAVLALGHLLFHSYWAGVLLATAVMCGAICWMLQGFLPSRWALLGALFCILRYGTFTYWVNSYFGGQVAATGGALLLGSLVRLRRRPATRYAVIFALGLALLANSRPLEGFCFALPALIYALWWWLRLRRPWSFRLVRVALPAATVLLATFAFIGYYNWRGTGHPLRFPYVENHAQYHITKPFFWQERSYPSYRHPVMRIFYTRHELMDYLVARMPGGAEQILRRKVIVIQSYFLWPLTPVFLIGLWCALFRSSVVKVVAALSLLLMLACSFCQVWNLLPHYLAPGASVFLLFTLDGLRRLRTWRPWHKPIGPALSRAGLFCLFLALLNPISEYVMNPFNLEAPFRTVPMSEIERVRMQSILESMPGRHLVIVVYHRFDNPGNDWVYNGPDIDSAKVVWARDMGLEGNQELLRYFANRQVWFTDRQPPFALLPYQQAVQSTALPGSGVALALRIHPAATPTGDDSH